MPSTLLTSSASSWTSWMVRRPVPHLLRLTLSQSSWETQIGLGSLLPTGRVIPNRIKRRWDFDLSNDALGWQSSHFIFFKNSLNVSQHYPSFKICLKQQLSECHLRLYLVLPVPHTLESPFSNTQYSYYTACPFKLLFHSHSINVPTEPAGRITFYSHDWWLKCCMCLCVQGVTCTTISLNMESSVRKKCASMLLKSSWVWSICTTASLFIGTSRYSRLNLTSSAINSNLMDGMCYFLLFWCTPMGHNVGSADVVLHYLELSLHGLLSLNPYSWCSSLNMKIVSKQRNIYIFCNISMHLTMFCSNLMKWNPQCWIVLAYLCLRYVIYCSLHCQL